MNSKMCFQVRHVKRRLEKKLNTTEMIFKEYSVAYYFKNKIKPPETVCFFLVINCFRKLDISVIELTYNT